MSDLVDEATAAAFGHFVERCFDAGTYINDKGESYPLVVLTSSIALPTGILAASDLEWPAHALEERSSVIARVPPGNYEIDSASLLIEDPLRDGSPKAMPRVTLLRMRCSPEAVETWAPALDDDGGDLWVEISRGVISLWDWSARDVLREFQREGVAPGAPIDDARERACASGNSMEMLRRGAQEILLTQCGLGADDYAVWHGLDVDGRLAQVAIDLRMVGWMTARYEPK